eukprot:5333775-Pleurochrysis_carterae.AAC.1
MASQAGRYGPCLNRLTNQEHASFFRLACHFLPMQLFAALAHAMMKACTRNPAKGHAWLVRVRNIGKSGGAPEGRVWPAPSLVRASESGWKWERH